MATSLVVNNQTQLEYQDSYKNGARAIATIYSKANESLKLHFIWKTGTGVGVDLSQYTGAFSVRERKDGHIVVAVCDTSGNADGTMTLDWGGNIKINMDYTKLQAMYKTGDWVWDLVLRSPDGVVTRLIEGDFKVDRGVTYLDNLAPSNS